MQTFEKATIMINGRRAVLDAKKMKKKIFIVKGNFIKILD
jgi:hypothetical protein